MAPDLTFPNEPYIYNAGNTLIVMWGIRRSGNHLLRNWLEYQFDRPTDNWMNCCLDIHCIREESAAEYVNCRVFSLEEKPIKTLDLISLQGYNRHKKVVVLRDPFNLFASRIRLYGLEGKDNLKEYATYLFLEYAKFFGKQRENPQEDIVLVSFNEFVKNQEYRKDICHQVGGEFDDTPAGFVDYNSGGSSFDGLKYQYNAQDMPVFNRWGKYVQYKEYRELFTEDIRYYSRTIFDFEPF